MLLNGGDKYGEINNEEIVLKFKFRYMLMGNKMVRFARCLRGQDGLIYLTPRRDSYIKSNHAEQNRLVN
jgi:hypothetical protein